MARAPFSFSNVSIHFSSENSSVCRHSLFALAVVQGGMRFFSSARAFSFCATVSTDLTCGRSACRYHRLGYRYIDLRPLHATTVSTELLTSVHYLRGAFLTVGSIGACCGTNALVRGGESLG